MCACSYISIITWWHKEWLINNYLHQNMHNQFCYCGNKIFILLRPQNPTCHLFSFKEKWINEWMNNLHVMYSLTLILIQSLNFMMLSLPLFLFHTLLPSNPHFSIILLEFINILGVSIMQIVDTREVKHFLFFSVDSSTVVFLLSWNKKKLIWVK